MNESVFRQKSIDRISSPEDLNSYMRVANPGIWIAIVSIVLILVGAVIWGVFGHVESTVTGVTVISGGDAVCYVSESEIAKIEEGMTVHIGDQDCVVSKVNTTPVVVEAALSSYALHLGGFENGEYVYPVDLESDLQEGNYESKIVTESISALSFLWN